MADPEVEIRRPEVREKEYVPRRIHLREKDFEEFGRTVGCKGCLAKMRGVVHAIHSDACRARMQKEMQVTDEGEAQGDADFSKTSGQETEQQPHTLQKQLKRKAKIVGLGRQQGSCSKGRKMFL